MPLCSILDRNACRSLAALLILAGIAPAAGAGDVREEAIELFEKAIRPVLVTECERCHGEQKQQGSLRLDSPAGWSQGGDSGPAVVPGDRDSLLLQAIRYESVHLEMPPKGKLPDATIAAFERWVDLGAVDPRQQPAESALESASPPAVEQGRQFWSFQPITDPAIPDVEPSAWPASDLDRFVWAKLRERGLRPSPPADPSTLLRRLYYDLIGLPPTPEQVASFTADPSPLAYRTTVSRLLGSELFGQRWGRHWLDVVRFAESSGGGRTLLFPDAWRYRDYVIEAFNRDLPFDQFVRQQIAGDLLETGDWQQRRQALTATAFLMLGPTNYELQDKDVLEMDVVDEQIDTLGKSLLGMTLGCARCHDHKFDPIPTADYYALAGIFKSSQTLIHDNVSKWNSTHLPLSPDQEAEAERLSMQLAELKTEYRTVKEAWLAAGGSLADDSGPQSIDTAAIEGIVVDDSQAALTGVWKSSHAVGNYVGPGYSYSNGDSQARAVYTVTLPAAGQYQVWVSYSAHANRTSAAAYRVEHREGTADVTIDQRRRPSGDGDFESLGAYSFAADQPVRVTIDVSASPGGAVIADAVVFRPAGGALTAEQQALARQWQRRREIKAHLERLQERIRQLESEIPRGPTAMVIADREQPGDIRIALGGATHNLGEMVARGALQVASWDAFPPIDPGRSGRRELADWIVDPRNPLTARVITNRIWYWLIGRGIVSTVDNFGATGQAPSHPELLDHLARSFIDDGWSMKRLIQRIVMSQTYQQSSLGQVAAGDPDNRYLARMNRKRLRAEDIRDSILLAAGALDLRYGGSGMKRGTQSEYDYQFVSSRRSVYVPVFRNHLPQIFEVFDFADPNIQRGHRSASIVASQALWLMNHPFVMDHASQAARRLLSQPGLSRDQRIQLAYLQVLSRLPDAAELRAAIDLIGEAEREVSSVDSALRGWADLYQVLFQCLDFRYLN